jgi:GrpB-like predicted nucleotidyltransferase (UPF0157 family)
MPSHAITILEYQSYWRSDFEQIASDLKAVLQGDAIRVDHIGSTAIQGWKKLFFMQRPGARRSNIHIRQVGTPNQRYPLLVRDILRHDARAAEAYGRLKRQLAENLADPDTYPDVKDPASDLIYLAVERWAAYENWQQAPAGAE